MQTDPHDLNRLAAYVEGRLSDAEAAGVTAHVAACVDCRTTLAAYARAIAAGAADERGVPAARRFAAKWLPIAAMLAIATVAGVVSLTRNRAPGPSPDRRPDIHLPSSPPAAQPMPAPSSGASRSDGGILPKRGTRRTVGGRLFRLESGDWIDASYDPFAMLPVVDAATPREKAALLARVPALRQYAALGERVIVVHDGTVYRLGPFSGARR